MQYIKDKKTNVLYNLTTLRRGKNKLIETNTQLTLLGKTFNITEKNNKKVNKELEEILKYVAWFSYRKHFKSIRSLEKDYKLTSDSGWGCMIRAGQMMLFVCLMKYYRSDDRNKLKYRLLSKYFKENDSINKNSHSVDEILGDFKALDEKDFNFEEKKYKEQVEREINDSVKSDKNLLNEFMDLSQVMKSHNKESLSDVQTKSSINTMDEVNPYDLFSIQNFVIKALIHLDTEPSSWFRPTTFLIILQRIIQENFDNLKMINIIHNTFVFKEIHEAVFDSKTDLSKSDIKTAINKLKTSRWDNKLILCISTMLGLKTLDPTYKVFLDKLMSPKSFCGFLGGQKQFAYYIIGKNNKNTYYYLDPHYVKETVTDYNNTELLESNYFKKNILQIETNELSSSVSLVFYLENKDDFKELWDILDELKEHYGDDYFMSYMLENLYGSDNAENECIMTF